MFRPSGEKLNFSSGMTSAASTTSFSMLPMARSTVEARVAGACGCCAGAAAGTAVTWVPCPRAVAVETIAAASQTSRISLILTIVTLHGIEQFLRVVSHPVFEDDLDVLDIR